MLKPINLPDNYQFNPVDYNLFIEPAQIFWFNLLKSYRKTVNEKYSIEYEDFADYFFYMKKLEAIAIFKNHDIIFNIYESKVDSYSHIYLQFPTYKEYRIYYEMSVEERKNYKLKLCNKKEFPITNFNIKYGYEVPTLISGEYDVTKNPGDLPEMGSLKGQQLATEHYNCLIAERKNRFSLFDLENYITQINSDHFQYEIEEAIKAYKNKLYLASTAVIGVALENLLSLLIVNILGEKKLPHRKYIKDYIKVLVGEGILDDRAGRRFDKFSDTRNGAAHSNSGRIYKEDAEQGFDLIKQLIVQFSSHTS